MAGIWTIHFWYVPSLVLPATFLIFLPFIPNNQVINTLIQAPSKFNVTSQHLIPLAWPILQPSAASLIVAGFS